MDENELYIAYSVIPGDAIIFRLGDHIDGVGATSIAWVKWDRLDITDCVWRVPI